MHLGAVLAAAATLAGPTPSPAPLPDGLLAFSRRVTGASAANDAPAIFTVRPDGRHLRLVVAGASDPRWSPNGRELVFTRDAPGGSFPQSEIWRSRWDGSGLRRLTANHSDHDPEWSPDGRRLLFIRSDPNAWLAARTALWTVRRDGSSASLLLRTRMGAVGDPEWSPDSRRVVFAATADRLYDVGSTGRDLRLLPMRGRNARWSPDGKKLAFLAPTKAGPALKIIDRTTGRVRTVDVNKTNEAQSALAWSADGRWLVSGRAREIRDEIGGSDSTYDLWCLRISDARRRLVVRNVDLDGLDWRRRSATTLQNR